MPVNAHSPFLEPEIETMPRTRLRDLQEERLLKIVPYAYEHAPLVREVWDEAKVHPRDIRSIKDFEEKAPFIDQDRVRRFRAAHHDGFGGTLCVPRERLLTVATTSGTTGNPTPIAGLEKPPPGMSPEALRAAIPPIPREWWMIGIRPGDIVAYVFHTFRGGLQITDYRAQGGVTPIFFDHQPYEMERFFDVSEELRPALCFMLSRPLILAIEDALKRTGRDPRRIFASYKAAICGGEHLGHRLQQLVKSWGLELYDFNALADVGSGLECPARMGAHALWEDRCFVEHLDPDGRDEAADGGPGELVGTALANFTAPLIRYRSDDLVWLTRAPCACGRTHLRYRVLGRKGDEVIVQGKSILPATLYGIVDQLPETEAGLFQIVRAARQADILRLRVGYAPAPTRGSVRELAGRLEELARGALGVPVSVDMVENAELLKLGPPHKIPRVAKQ